MRTLKVGVVGCGEIAQIMHLPFLHELEQFEIVAICDVSEKVLEAVGDRFNVEHRFKNHRDMLDSVEPDVVAVLTMEHTKVAIDAAKAGVHIFVEKPIAFNVEHAEAICRAAKDNHVQIMVGYMKLFDEGYLHAVNLFHKMEGVKLIRVQDFTGRWDRHQPLYTLVSATDLDPNMRKSMEEELDGIICETLGSDDTKLNALYRMLLMLCSHDMAVLRGAFGVPSSVLSVQAPTNNFLAATLSYDDGKIVSFEAGTWVKYPWFQEEIVAYGRDEIVGCQFANPYVRYSPTEVVVRSQRDDKPVEMRWTPSNQEAFRNEWLHFYECITENVPSRSSGQDAIDDLRLARQIIQKLQDTEVR